MHPRLLQAAGVALSTGYDPRNFLIGAIGIRRDGAIVAARNGAVHCTKAKGGFSFPKAHAEFRCSRKMDTGSEIYVARVLKNGELAMSKPCAHCENVLRARGIKTVYYTINQNEYGVLSLG